MWKKLMSVWLCGEGYYGIVSGDDTEPTLSATPTNDEKKSLKEWRAKDDLGVSSICMCLSKSIFMQADIESGSHTLWEWLLAKYDQKTELDVLHLETQIDLLQFHDGEDLQKHIDNLQELFNDLEACGKEYTLSDNAKKLRFYKSLPESWTTTVCSFMTNNSKITWDELVARMLQIQLLQSERGATKVDQALYLSQKKRWSKDNSSGSKQSHPMKHGKPIAKNQCRYCEKFGHYAAECRKKKADMGKN
ncbi:hypothetical protein R1flu_001839 [Riccia fluitans]|uniref:CCHC-type domain-containing protein n=1 Tax=Riccia fluitans TaxID=41844 RepID=A0ABD1Y8E0_9MARC